MGRYFRSFGGMCWPAPGEDMSNLSRKLVHGQPTKDDLMVCAAVIGAYTSLVHMATTRRADIVRELKKGPNGPEPAQLTSRPQLRDNEPKTSGRHCPFDNRGEDD
jgi:hypothetical protein